MADLKTILGYAIKSKRSELALSQEELADRAGLHRTYVSDIERGARNLSLESIEKLAMALELSVSTLFGRLSDGGELADVLLVEDDPADVELTQRAFRAGNIANPLRVVWDGAEALEYLFGVERPAVPGLILLDLNLPEVDGLEVLRRVRDDPRTRDIPVVVLTVSGKDEDLAACRRMGVTAYLQKPVGWQSLGEITPHLPLAWALIQRSRAAGR